MPLKFADAAHEAYEYPLLIKHLLSSALVVSGDQEIVYRDQRTLTYREMVGRVGRLANVLETVGVEQGTTVAVMDWDSHRYLESYFAVPMMGAVMLTANIRLPVAQLAYTLDHADAEVIIVHRDFFDILEEMLPQLPKVKAVIAILDGQAGEMPAASSGEYEDLLAKASPDYDFPDFDENALATTFFTSGTTGNPKGVCFSHRQLVLHTLVSAGAVGAPGKIWGLGVGDVYMPLTPMFHVHAWGLPYQATMLGVKQVYPGRYETDMICKLQREHEVTFSHGVPTVLQMVLDEVEASNSRVDGWKMAVGGSPIPRPLYDRAIRAGMKISAGYGMSEAAATVSRGRLVFDEGDNEDLIIDRMTCAGTPAPLVYVRIVDEYMNPLPHDGVTRGELVARAPWFTPCYTGNSAASSALWAGGWMHTQDIATIDRNGFVRIRDRLKDIVKSGGEWIDSVHLEDLICVVPGVKEVSVVAIPDERWGERPLAVIVPAEGAEISLEAINAPIENAISKHEITRYAKLQRFEIVEGLPRTSVGKIDKKQLRAMFGDAG